MMHFDVRGMEMHMNMKDEGSQGVAMEMRTVAGVEGPDLQRLLCLLLGFQQLF